MLVARRPFGTRTSYIYRYAILFQSCPVVSAALRKTATLLNARELRNLWNYVFCKGVRWHSNWSLGQCLIQCHCHKFSINREKTHLSKWMSRLQCCHFLYMELFYLILFCLFLWLHRRIVCNDYNAVYSRLMLFLWSVIECYQYSLWHNINLDLVPVPLNGMFVFWIYIVITDDKSALVRQMAWYRQATNHYLN